MCVCVFEVLYIRNDALTILNNVIHFNCVNNSSIYSYDHDAIKSFMIPYSCAHLLDISLNSDGGSCGDYEPTKILSVSHSLSCSLSFSLCVLVVIFPFFSDCIVDTNAANACTVCVP